MADPLASAAHKSKRQAAPAAWYAAAVVGLATFLVGLLVSHPPIAGYQAEAHVTRALPSAANQGANSPAAIDVAAAESWLKSDATLQDIAQQAGIVNRVGDLKLPLTSKEVALIRDGLQLLVSTDGDTQQWLIQYTGSSRDGAKRIAQQSADLMAGYLDRATDLRPSEAEIATLRHEVRLAVEEEERLKGEVEQLRHEQLAAVLVQQRNGMPSVPEAVAAPSAARSTRRRDSIIQKIDELRSDYRKLVATRLLNHPSVVAIADQIQQLEVQLQELPDTETGAPLGTPSIGLRLEGASALKPRNATAATFVSLSSSGPLDPAITSSARIDEARLRLRETGNRRIDAQRRLEVANELAVGTWKKQWTVNAAGAAQRIGGTPRSSDLLWAALIGIVAATTISIDWNWFNRIRVLSSAAHARNALRTPLLGEIALPAGNRPAALPTLSPAKLRLIRGAEWLLIVALFLLILAAVSQRELAAQMISDPFGAMTEAFDCLRAMVR
jgi:hypothetical protein